MTGDARRSGAERDELHQHGGDHDDEHRRYHHREPAPASRVEHHVGADHDQLAVGEVHQAHDAEEQRERERHQREQAAVGDRVDHVLDSIETPPMKIMRRPPSPCRCTHVSKSPISASSSVVPWNWIRPPAPHHVRAVGDLDRPCGVLLDEQDRHALARCSSCEDLEHLVDDHAAQGRASARRGAAASGAQAARGRSRAAAARRPRASSRTGRSSARARGSARACRSMSLSTARGPVARSSPILRFSPDGQAAEDSTALGNERDARTEDLVRRAARDRTALECDVAGRRLEDAGDRQQRRRLAGAVVADEADELALVDLEREPLHGCDPAVVHRDVIELEQSRAPFCRQVGRDHLFARADLLGRADRDRSCRSRAPGSARRPGR